MSMSMATTHASSGTAPLNQPMITNDKKTEVAKLPQLLSSLEDLEPTIPMQAIDHLMAKSGAKCSDDNVKRMIGLAAEKFIFEVTQDALQYGKNRIEKEDKKVGRHASDAKVILTMEDAASSLREQGIDIVRPPYHIGAALQ